MLAAITHRKNWKVAFCLLALAGITRSGCTQTVKPKERAMPSAAKSPNAGKPSRNAARSEFVAQTDDVRLTIGSNGLVRHLVDRRDGTDYGLPGSVPFAHIKKGGVFYPSSKMTWSADRMTLSFGAANVRAVLRVAARRHYFQVDVVSVQDASGGVPAIDELSFGELKLTRNGAPLRGGAGEKLAACALARNLQTNVPDLPQPTDYLRAFCYPRFGLAGASVALVVCPPNVRRRALQQAVSEAPELPHSRLGGPWAMDHASTRGSYMFNYGDLTAATAPEWIKLAKSAGVTQIDLHGGTSFRFGDIEPNPKTYPQGFKSMKAMTDKLHDVGILAGLHTYAFFIDKKARWVTPVPDPRLGKDATFTLAAPLDATAATVPVAETTQAMSTITGFFVRNSVTIQIDDELITYTGVSKTAPYGFTGCVRGALGTRAAPHAAGAKVSHLKEMFGLFCPDPDSTLFTEIAARTAQAFNEGGFDMIYLDALDGEGILAGDDVGWHYGSKFVYEICKRLKKPAIMEMSVFQHHLWCVRSRGGAWDAPNRGYKKFIDLHVEDNKQWERMFLPSQLGWWNFQLAAGPQYDVMYPDDIDYLGSKALGTDAGLAFLNISESVANPRVARLAAVMKNYQDAAREQPFSPAVKARLRKPGVEFKLERDGAKGWRLREMNYSKHKAQSGDDRSLRWTVRNPFGAQSLRLRIEALAFAGPYNAADNTTLADFSRPGEAPAPSSATGVTTTLAPANFGGFDEGRGTSSGRWQGTSSLPQRAGSWAWTTREYSPPLNLGTQQALGVWVHGDGQGAVLSFQVQSPAHVSTALGEHYVVVDFTGWRYFELIEPESERRADYLWPYGETYALYLQGVDYAQIGLLSVWCNNLPPGKEITTYIGPVKALPLVFTPLRNPTITVGGQSVTFPVEIANYGYLEIDGAGICKLYAADGAFVREVTPSGPIPKLAAGDNSIVFRAETASGSNARANVTVIAAGGLLPRKETTVKTRIKKPL